MNKNVKSIFLVATLLILLIGVSAISASEASDDNTIIQDTADTVAPEVTSTPVNNDKVVDTPTKNIKKETKTHIVNNNTITNVFSKEGTSPYNDAGFNASLLGDDVEEGDTLDFQGQITGNYNLTINKAVNIISSTHDANISLNTSCLYLTGDYPGNHFIITHEGSYSNITGINFYNTQLFVYNATCVTLDNISAIVYNQPVGGGVGQTSIRENSTNITVKNSNFYTYNNGGSSTLVLAWADNCTISNNTINAGGESGNLLYLTTYNLVPYPPSDVIPNSNNLIINNTIGDKNLVTGGIRLACVLTGSNNTIRSNNIYGQISGQYGVGTSEIKDLIIEDNNVTMGINGNTHALIKNNNISGNSYIYYNSTVEHNTFENVTLNQNDITFRDNTVNGIIDISSSNNTLKNNIVISPYDYAIVGGTNCTIKNNYISTYYLAGEDAIVNGTNNILENNTPERGVTITITDDTYSDYFNDEGKIYNPIITNYSTIILSGEFNNRNFDIDNYILSINGETKSTTLRSSQIISRQNSRIKVKTLTINNTESNIENMIVLESEYNTIENCNLIDYSTSTDKTHRTIIVNGKNNIITNNNINTSAPSVNINYSSTPALPDCISIVLSSSNNKIVNNKIQTVSASNNNEYGTIEAIAIQGIESQSSVEDNNISRNTITVQGADYVYGINIGQNANNNILSYNNIKSTSTIYSAGIQVLSTSNNNNISNNNINSTAATTNDKSAYGIILINDSYDTVKSIENNTLQNNNLRIVGYNSYGIEIFQSNNNLITDNTVTITNSNYATGIALTGYNNIISRNKLSITGKSNQTSTSYDNILPTTSGINLVNAYNNTLSENKMNITQGSGISFVNASQNDIEKNNVSVKTSVGLNIYNSQDNNITANNITTDNTHVILLNQSTTNTIKDNRLITSNAYVITIIDSTNNNILNNYMTGSSYLGDNSVEQPDENLVENNTPSFENAIYINNITYSNYFDNEGNIKDNSIPADSLVIIIGDLYDKDMVFDVPVNISVYGSTPVIYNSTIFFKEGSNGSNSTAQSSELTSRIYLRNYETNTPSIIIENTSNINLSVNIMNYGQNNDGIKIFNSTDITLYNNSGISAYALNTTGLNVDKSSNLNLDLRTNSQYNNFIGMKFSNTENVTIFNQESIIIRSEISNDINSTLIQINENSSNFNITNKVIVRKSRENCYILKINATEDKPANNITYDGFMDVYRNQGKAMTAISTNYCYNSTFGGNITIHADNQNFLVYDIKNSDNNLFNTIINNIYSSYSTLKSENTLAKLLNSNNNTFTDITFTPSLTNQESENSNHGITLNNSNNNKIINNKITVNDDYAINLYNSNNNIILENYLNATAYGNYSVLEENCSDNLISNNTPEQLKLTDDNYNQYFNENSELITPYNIIEISSDINNKNLKITNPVYIFNGNDYQLNNVSIYMSAGSENSIIEGLNINNTNEALLINNTNNIQITNNTILLPNTQGEAIIVTNSDNITFSYNYIETKDLISNLAIKNIESTNINYINNTPIPTLTNDNYNQFFDDDEKFKYDVLDKIILGSDLNNKNLIFNSAILILNPDKHIIYNGTITITENVSNMTINDLIINNSINGKSSFIIKSSHITLKDNQIYQTSNNTDIILITNATGNDNTGIVINNNNITFTGNDITALEINNINYVSMDISQNTINGIGNDNIILDIQNIENPAMAIGSNKFKLNTTQASTVININNINGTAPEIAFYLMQNIIVSTSIQNTTPLIQLTNNPFIAYITMNFIESRDLKGDAAVSGNPQYTMGNYPQNGIYRLVEVTANFPEIMIVNKTYNLTFTITDLVGDEVNKGILYMMIGNEEYLLDITDSTAKFKYTPTEIENRQIISFQYMDEQYEYAMLEGGNAYVKVVEASLTIDPITATVGQTINITARITADNETITDINKGKVTFKVNGKTLKDENGKVIYAKVINGTATIEDYLVPYDWTKEGTTIQAVYSGSTQCDKLRSKNTEITVAKAVPTFTIENVTTTVGGTITLKATITDNDKVINTGKIVFKINGKTIKDASGKVIYAKVTNGQVSVEYPLPEDMDAKDYTITAVYIPVNGDKLESNATMTVTTL